MMERVKLFENGRNQATPFVPKEVLWQTFIDGLEGFTSDIFQDGRDQGIQEEREIEAE